MIYETMEQVVGMAVEIVDVAPARVRARMPNHTNGPHQVGSEMNEWSIMQASNRVVDVGA